ncbi:hypothetical protein [Halogeometricum limi]|uniref:Uncharacterized protein n=1 Tax=Halogeometricum limi TaxID=555875 RepID=A0A1I6IME1_9EURY|nr:hypothetical protein [Halogeometricum limi]SFR67864.1 hypothetical protein SAMN04488124_3414 [Halogeometricum limi]
MSLAITHFAFGAAVTMLVVTFLAPRLRFPRTVSVLGGIWAMVPDAHHVSPAYTEFFRSIQESVYANVFWAHGYLDTLDPADTNEAALVAIAFFLVATVVAETAEYYFETGVQRRFGREARAQATVSSLGGTFATRESRVTGSFSRLGVGALLRTVRLVGGLLAVVGGVGLHYLLFRTGSYLGLFAGVGALLELVGAVTLLEDPAVTRWTDEHLSPWVRDGARAGVVVAACLLALPLVFSLSTPTPLAVLNAAVGGLLVLTAVRL